MPDGYYLLRRLVLTERVHRIFVSSSHESVRQECWASSLYRLKLLWDLVFFMNEIMDEAEQAKHKMRRSQRTGGLTWQDKAWQMPNKSEWYQAMDFVSEALDHRQCRQALTEFI